MHTLKERVVSLEFEREELRRVLISFLRWAECPDSSSGWFDQLTSLTESARSILGYSEETDPQDMEP